MSTQTFVSNDSTRIACVRSGSGTPLVLVHGGMADHTRWAPILPALDTRFTVYACDRRGRGASGDVADYTIEREFEDVAAVIDGIGGPVDVLGHSYGALCSLEASARAANLRRLVLYEPTVPIGGSINPPGMVERLQAMLDAGDREGVVTTFLREILHLPAAQLAVMQSAPAWKARVSAAHTIVRELRANERYVFDPARLSDVRVPVLLLLGGASPPFFKEALERVHQALSNSCIVVLPDQKHTAMDTAPELFVGELLKVLSAK